jgi:hypothetical protein
LVWGWWRLRDVAAPATAGYPACVHAMSASEPHIALPSRFIAT